MTSKVALCNQACTKIGAARIISMDDASKQAKALNAIFDVKRDAELSAHPWTFATGRASLPASATAPDYGWSAAYPLPSDFLTLVEVGENYVMYQDPRSFDIENTVDGLAILCNEASPLRIRYVKRIEVPGLFHPLFVEALACRLAAEIAEDVTQSTSKRELAWKEYGEAIRLAKRTNAIQRPPQPIPDAGWWLAREG